MNEGRRSCLLLELIAQRDWEGAWARVSSHPEEACYKSADGCTALHAACCGDIVDPALIETLLSLYPKGVQVKDSAECTPLHYAVCGFHQDMDPTVVRILLDAFPEAASVPDTGGLTPLHIAYSNKDINASVTSALLATFPKAATLQDMDGRTPLHHACCNRHLETNLVRALLSAYPDAASIADCGGDTPLHCLCWKSYKDASLVKELLHSFPEALSMENKAGLTPLHCLCWHPDVNVMVVKALLDTKRHRTVAAMQDSHGSLPLHYACYGSKLEVIALLVQVYPQGCAVRDREGCTPLHIACRNGADDPKMVEELLRAHPDSAFSQDNNGDTPLHEACRHDEIDPAVIRSLLSPIDENTNLAANVADIPNLDGMTSLHVACANKHMSHKVISLVLNNVTSSVGLLQDSQGRTALHWAHHCDPSVVHEVLGAFPGAVWVQDSLGSTPLHGVCNEEDADDSIVESMLEIYPDAAGVQNSYGNTPLHLSCISHGSEQVTRVLVKADKNNLVSLRNKEGRTPLQALCAEYSFELDFLTTVFTMRDDMRVSGRSEVHKLALQTWTKACILLRASYGYHSEEMLLDGKRWRFLHACAGLDSCPVALLRCVLKVHEQQLRERDEHGNLPIHLAASCLGRGRDTDGVLLELVQAFPDGAKRFNSDNKLPIELACQGKVGSCDWGKGFKALVDTSIKALASMNITSQLYSTVVPVLAAESPPSSLFELVQSVPFLVKDLGELDNQGCYACKLLH